MKFLNTTIYFIYQLFVLFTIQFFRSGSCRRRFRYKNLTEMFCWLISRISRRNDYITLHYFAAIKKKGNSNTISDPQYDFNHYFSWISWKNRLIYSKFLQTIQDYFYQNLLHLIFSFFFFRFHQKIVWKRLSLAAYVNGNSYKYPVVQRTGKW